MKSELSLSIEFPRAEDAERIEEIQNSWVGERVGSVGFLTSPESVERLREMIHSQNILVARRGPELLAFLTFYRRSEWEVFHPEYAASLDYISSELRAEYEDRDYVVIDHIAKSKSAVGDAPVRLVLALKRLVEEWGIDWFLGEISPDNERSTVFFKKVLKAIHIGRTVRAGVDWDVYAAPSR